jgi:hypothetical protein
LHYYMTMERAVLGAATGADIERTCYASATAGAWQSTGHCCAPTLLLSEPPLPTQNDSGSPAVARDFYEHMAVSGCEFDTKGCAQLKTRQPEHAKIMRSSPDNSPLRNFTSSNVRANCCRSASAPAFAIGAASCSSMASQNCDPLRRPANAEVGSSTFYTIFLGSRDKTRKEIFPFCSQTQCDVGVAIILLDTPDVPEADGHVERLLHIVCLN